MKLSDKGSNKYQSVWNYGSFPDYHGIAGGYEIRGRMVNERTQTYIVVAFYGQIAKYQIMGNMPVAILVDVIREDIRNAKA